MDEFEIKRRKSDSAGIVRKNWEILVTVAVIIVASVTVKVNVENLDKRLCKTEIATEDIGSMKKDIDWIKRTLERIEERQVYGR